MPGSIDTTEKCRVLLVGSGAIGTMAAYALEVGGKAEVTSVLRSNFAAVNANGFSIDSVDHGKGIKGFKTSHVLNAVPNVATDGTAPFDYIIVTTKNIPDVPPTVSDIIAPAVTPGHTAIVLLQNGLNIEKPLIKRFPTNVILSGITLLGAAENNGYVSHNETDFCRLGVFRGQSVDADAAKASVEKLLDAYNACGKVDWIYDADVAFSRWRKLLYNGSFNVVAAITGIDAIRMRMSKFMIDDLISPLIREIRAIAKADGVDLPEDLEMFFIMCDTPADFFMPSMGQDSIKGNYMEVENIVGEPLKEAQRLGVPAPVLSASYHYLRSLQLKAKEKKGLWKPVFEAGNPYAA